MDPLALKPSAISKSLATEIPSTSDQLMTQMEPAIQNPSGISFAGMELKTQDEASYGSDPVNNSCSNNNCATVMPVPQIQLSSISSAVSTTSVAPSSRNKKELLQNISPESNSGSNKSYQFCRICHEGDLGNCSGISPCSSQGSTVSRREPLIAPCRCTGSVAKVHLSCLEHWLTTSNSEKCELCHFLYKTKKMPRTWTEFLTESDNQFNVRNMIADLICFFLLTPLLVISTYLCCLGAHQYYIRERWEAVGLVTLSVFLLAVYFTWCHVTLKYHFGVWQTWARTHQRVQLSLRENNTGGNHERTSLRSTSSGAIITEEGLRQPQHSDESSSASSTHQFEYVNFLEEDSDYFDYHGTSRDNLYIVNQNNGYNQFFPYGFNRPHSSEYDSGMRSGSNIFAYHPVIVIPSRRPNQTQSHRLLPTTTPEANFPVMGLSSFSRNSNNNTNINGSNTVPEV